MLAFVGDSELCVNHKNLNRTDNRLENLEYVTHKQNTKHARELLGNWTPRGQNHGMSKLTRNQVKEIRQLCKSKTQRSVAKQYNLSEAQISRIVNKRRWS
jgi:Mor family transcriptional regulator